MPGIVGIVSKRPAEDYSSLVKSMASSMAHEAFYTLGIYCVPEMGIYAAWVTHQNSFAAAQPFTGSEPGTTLLFSGECFQDDPSRDRGQPSGDSLIRRYEREGEQLFPSLNGLFSGLLIDEGEGK